MKNKQELIDELKLLDLIGETNLPEYLAFYAPESGVALYLPTDDTNLLKMIFPQPVSQYEAKAKCSQWGITSAIFYAINDPRF